MKYRKLRIAWSVACGAFAVSVCVLWVRSNSRSDIVVNNNAAGSGLTFGSNRGTVYVSRWRVPAAAIAFRPIPPSGGWKHSSRDPYEFYDGKGMYDLRYMPSQKSLRVPNYLLVVLTAAFTAVPWFHWSNRFSLSTLLIGMTLIAAALGAIVYAVR